MGEYAYYNGKQIKVGTCENFSGMRYEDSQKVSGLPRSLVGIRFRLPWKDEDHISPGDYEEFRGLRLCRSRADYNPPWLADAEPGSFQFTHPSGLLFSVPCHHGVKLPDLGEQVNTFWNGKSWSLQLIALKVLDEGLLGPIVACRHCGTMWLETWDAVMPYISDPEMYTRLKVYADHSDRFMKDYA